MNVLELILACTLLDSASSRPVTAVCRSTKLAPVVTTVGSRGSELKLPRWVMRSVRAVSKCDASAVKLEAMALLSAAVKPELEVTPSVAAVTEAVKAVRSVVTGYR